MAARDEIVEALDAYLEIEAVDDASLNGLQVEGDASVARVALAVDASESTIRQAAEVRCQLLLVHHGLFWGDPAPLVGPAARRVGACFAAGLSVYAAHLPLDRHAEVGNNVLLARALGGDVDGWFGEVGGVPLGVTARLAEGAGVGELAGRMAAAGCHEPLIWSFGPERIERLAVVTGAGCGLLDAAIDAGADCFVTGEPRHAAYHAARERRVHCLFGGHYATETLGVRATGEWLAERFGVDTVWIDEPTGV